MAIETKLTLGDLETAIDEYEGARARKETAEADLIKAREQIVQAFKESGMRGFRDSKSRTTTVNTRYTEHILVKEAAVLLNPDTYQKLAHQAVAVVVNIKYPGKES